MAPIRDQRRQRLLLLALFLAPAVSLSAWAAERTAVRVSPLAADRQALDTLFEGGASAQRFKFLFTPETRSRPRVQAAPTVFPAVPKITYNGVQVPTVLFSHEDRVSKTLVSVIDKTQRTMDVALYVLSLPDVAEALVRAKQRGVAARVIMDHGHAFPSGGKPRSKELDTIVNGGVVIRTLAGGGSYGIMHHKFGVFDGKLIEAGSFNWTEAGNTKNFENAVFRDEANLIAGFQAAFDWMWPQAKPLSGLIQPGEPGAPPAEPKPSLSFKGRGWPAFMFSPNGGTEAKLIEAVSLCKARLDIAMFSFFSQPLGQAVIEARNRGVAVRVVVDRGQGRNSPISKLFADNGIDLKFSSGVGGVGVLHHKFALFDNEMLETGSFNYSQNAEVNNHENSLFSTKGDDLKAFGAEFDYLYAQALLPTADDLAPQPAFTGQADDR